MSKAVRLTAAGSLIAAALSGVMYGILSADVFLSLAITFGTTAYHLIVRLLSGAVFGRAVKLWWNYTKGWFQVRPWEMKLYKSLNVKAWKDKMPTYSPEDFSPRIHTWEEIAVAMCRSELVHEANAVLSFLPLAASIWLGAFWVFLITSLCGAAFDLSLVAIQRYNRARIAKIASRGRVNHH